MYYMYYRASTMRAGVEPGTTITLSLTIDGIVSFPDLFQRSYSRLLSCARSKMSTEGSDLVLREYPGTRAAGLDTA